MIKLDKIFINITITYIDNIVQIYMKSIFCLIFAVNFMLLSNMLSIVNVQGETYKDEYSAINNNLKRFGEPI